MSETSVPSASPTSSATRAASTWAAGDYPAMARRLVPVADRVIAAAGVAPGTTLLDVGCGTGNAALAAARLGAVATGTDPTPELLAVAARRAREEGLPVTWQEASADRLTGVHDRVVSVFGAMYAPDPRRAAASMVEHCAPGGRIVSAAWTPDGFMAAASRAMGRYLPPPPPDAGPPTHWGDADKVREWFAAPEAGGATEIATSTDHVRLAFASPIEAAEFWVRTAGHLQAERRRLEASGAWQALHHDLAALFTEWNRTPGSGVEVESSYLLAVVTRSV
ncbi:class I SAM-dependent methyltransferase [Streptomyces sp. NPDC049837]|uniref:class I SAM-dependent methyltransferase n=1 Tax=Streptomyces sp. NPDC049837 TaxID=3155277 RepID=UPI0034439C5C